MSAVIKVVGVGGGGGNAVQRMIESGIQGVEFIVMNTDVQVLDRSPATKKVQLGINYAKGLGAGGDPASGRASAEESKADIRKALEGADMVFITACMGGGTGTGAAEVIADVAQEMDALTVAVVTKPFKFEGVRRERRAEEGIKSLLPKVDTIITIPNDKILSVVERKTTLQEAFRVADDVLRQGVQGISDIITIPGEINVDFADVRAVMKNQGPALMGIGYGVGEHRALQAAKSATSSPLLEQTIHGAKALLVNITASDDMTLAETSEAMNFIHELCDQEEVNIIFGTVTDPSLEGTVRISVLATGFDPNARPMSPPPVSPTQVSPTQVSPTQVSPTSISGVTPSYTSPNPSEGAASSTENDSIGTPTPSEPVMGEKPRITVGGTPTTPSNPPINTSSTVNPPTTNITPPTTPVSNPSDFGEKKESPFNLKPVETEDLFNEEEIDIPTFLREHKDKNS
jgi:cell division protein FtsZ